MLNYHVLYKQRPCSLFMKRSLPEIQFSGTQYQPQNFVEGKLNKVFPKKNWYLYKALFEDFEKSSSIAKKRRKALVSILLNHLGVVLVPPLICILLMEIIH